MKLAYLVSRFPTVTETFVLRELDAVAAQPGVELELLTLFSRGSDTVHPAARKWLPRVRRGTPARAATGLGWWLTRRPLRMLSSIALIVRGYGREPELMVRALVAFAAGAGHARSMRELGVEHVHAHFAGHPTVAAWAISRLAGISYSITAHAYDLFLSQAFLERKVRDARFVVAISEYNRRFLAEYGGGHQTPVHVVHCGIEPAAYAFREDRLPAVGPVATLCVASLQEHKGHRFLLEALAHGGDVGRVELTLVGDGQLREGLERLAGELGVSDRVRFLGSLPEDEVAGLLDGAQLFVLPSIVGPRGRMEGLPVSLMEALAAGVPAVATRISGVPELVRDGETGVLAEQADAPALAGALERTLADTAAAAERARAGRRLVEAEFDVADTARELVRLFRAP